MATADFVLLSSKSRGSALLVLIQKLTLRLDEVGKQKYGRDYNRQSATRALASKHQHHCKLFKSERIRGPRSKSFKNSKTAPKSRRCFLQTLQNEDKER